MKFMFNKASTPLYEDKVVEINTLEELIKLISKTAENQVIIYFRGDEEEIKYTIIDYDDWWE